MMPAILCGVLRVIEQQNNLDAFLRAVDWQEVGCTEEYAKGWWAEHKRRDAERREKERRMAEREKIVQLALEKLSLAERQALGL